ncbi:MAG: sigma-54-dependent Fis family transcriptional regulator [Nitrospirae bacterium]|nr:sigma-54-dependent Fis family transcriptional regulator [Nitrospirota bacterium]
MPGEKILVVDDEPGMRSLLRKVLGRAGYFVTDIEKGADALAVMDTEDFDLAILDIEMPEMDGIELLKKIKKKDPALNVVMITAYGSLQSAVEAMRLGAYDYLTKPFQMEEIKLVVEKALERERLVNENRALHKELEEQYRFTGIIGKSQKMEEVYDLVRQVAATNASVLIQGESGTGKELIARSIHYNSKRKGRPLVILNCAALAEGVLESELFGHEKGSFTGAIKQKAGRFELAHDGTLFLDEIGEIPVTTQLKLLRVLQEHEFERVGGEKTIKVDVRIIAATNKDLMSLVREKRFREDLYYRLNVVAINLPPLRERREDIPELAHHFLKRFALETGKKIEAIDPKAMDSLVRYDWPGNVRELENIIERAVVLEKTGVIMPASLPLTIRDAAGDATSLVVPEGTANLTETLEFLERQLIVKALDEHGGSQTAAALSLGLKRSTFRYKLEKYGLVTPGEGDAEDGDG